jgi:DNA-binding XRE family transcriptional regulator
MSSKAAGWRTGTVTEFLELTPEDEAVIEARLVAHRARKALAALVKESRGTMTQAELAKRMNTTQPRIAKIEKASDNVSLDQYFGAAQAAGADLKKIGKVLVKAG